MSEVLRDEWESAQTTTITLTGAMARKIGRISALYPDVDLRIVALDDSDEYVHVEVLDEYGGGRARSAMSGEHFVCGFVIRENGWSNPSIAHARAEARS